tara:strand:- start:9619 stop:10716 length:1098 start_codon:yes stop_codon:yes gene_type:complete
MKKVLLYGEFTPKSTTGIAYMNSILERSLINLGYKVKKIIEPRTKDYYKKRKIIKKNFNLKDFIKLFFFLIFTKKHDISFITISMGNIGLVKTAIIQFLLSLKSHRIYLYVHRGDLNKNFNSSIYKKFIISLILKNAFKVIFLSKIFKENNKIKSLEDKVIILPNALGEEDCYTSKRLFNIKKSKIKKSKNKKIINFLYFGNIQKEKGINNILKAIKIINNNNKGYRVKLDVYGMNFEDINFEHDFIEYKGKLETKERLKYMSKYDCLITASLNEGLPMILIESLSIGLPFITTKVGAIEDLLINNYPYVCDIDILSIKDKIHQFCIDLNNNKIKLIKIIIENNNLFLNKFEYSIFEKNIKEYIY